MDDTMLMVSICERFGWTYEQYFDQPLYFLKLIAEKQHLDDVEIRRSQQHHARSQS